MSVRKIASSAQVETLHRDLAKTVEAGIVLRVEVERWKNKRTIPQNRRMWLILNALAQAAPPHMDGIWYSPKAWHHYFKGRFLGFEEGPFGSVEPKSTTGLSTVEFSGYNDQIEAWIAEEGIQLELEGY